MLYSFPPPTRERMPTRTHSHHAAGGNGSREEFILLGAWDSDPDRNVLSYLTPMGQALLNHKPGEEVAMEGDDRRFRIESIAAHNPGSAAATPAAAAYRVHRSQQRSIRVHRCIAGAPRQ